MRITPLPTKIQCAKCGTVALAPVAGGGIGGPQWSDGFYGLSEGRFSALLCCPSCDALLFRGDGELTKDGERFTHEATHLSIKQKIAALGEVELSGNLELAVRINLWHCGNHQQRGIECDLLPSDFRRENLRWLLSHFESKPRDDRDEVVEAELLRELGLFDEALARMEMAILSGSVRALATARAAHEKSTQVCVVRESVVVIY